MRHALLLAATAAAIGWGALAQAQEADSASSDNAATETAVADMAQGAEDAPVTVVEYGSFTCPHCMRWHEESYPLLKEEFVDTGKVRFIFREVYFDRPGLWASMLARCGGEMRFFGIHDLLYGQQSEWIGDGEGATIAANLRTLGLSAGLDEAAIDACMNDQAQAETLVAWYQANAEADGVEGTPTFVINGEKHTNMPFEEMRDLIEAEIAEAGQ